MKLLAIGVNYLDELYFGCYEACICGDEDDFLQPEKLKTSTGKLLPVTKIKGYSPCENNDITIHFNDGTTAIGRYQIHDLDSECKLLQVAYLEFSIDSKTYKARLKFSVDENGIKFKDNGYVITHDDETDITIRDIIDNIDISLDGGCKLIYKGKEYYPKIKLVDVKEKVMLIEVDYDGDVYKGYFDVDIEKDKFVDIIYSEYPPLVSENGKVLSDILFINTGINDDVQIYLNNGMKLTGKGYFVDRDVFYTNG